MKTILPITVVFLSVICSQSFAQFSIPKYEIGLSVGGYVYQGDLTPGRFGSLKTIRPGFSLSGARLLSHVFSVRANISYGRLVGNESLYSHPEYRQQRNFKFSTPVWELGASIVYNVFGTNLRPSERPRLTPYITAGVSLAFLNIKRDWSGVNTSYFGESSTVITGLATDTTHRTPSVLPVVPIGVGLRYSINDRWAATVETSYRITVTDYLDGFSDAANSGQKDYYHSTSIGIVYRFIGSKGIKCPKF